MNDVHYYLSGCSSPVNAMYYISGMNFTPHTGEYLLPFSEGNFLVYNDHSNKAYDSYIKMNPKGTDNVY